MDRSEKLGFWLTLVFTVAGVYFAVRGIHESRDIPLQTEEHRALLRLATGHQDSWGRYLTEYEEARWLVRVHDIMVDSAPMRLAMHFELCGERARKREYEVIQRNRQFRLRLLQENLRASLPAQLTLLLSKNDDVAMQELDDLLTASFYAHLFDSWEQGQEWFKARLTDPSDKERLGQLFNTIGKPNPRNRHAPLLP